MKEIEFTAKQRALDAFKKLTGAEFPDLPNANIHWERFAEITEKKLTENAKNDPVNHPAHYTGHPSGVECIQITEHLNFCRGNAVKYIWRADDKGDPIENLKKARWYIDREIARLEKEIDKLSTTA